MSWASALASGVSNTIGTVLNYKANKDAISSQEKLSQANVDWQREFAQNGIRWRVADAQEAGMHPLYALGASIPTFSPVSSNFSANTAVGDGVREFGQNLSRAIQANMDPRERAAGKMVALQVERGELENELLRSQIAREKSQLGPGLSIPGPLPGSSVPGVGEIPVLVEEMPLQRIAGEPGMGWQEPGAVSDVGFARTPTGLAPVPSQDVKNRIEDQIIPEVMWSLRNNLMPNLGIGTPPSKRWLPRGAVSWRWYPGMQEWRPRYPKPLRKPSKWSNPRLFFK